MLHAPRAPARISCNDIVKLESPPPEKPVSIGEKGSQRFMCGGTGLRVVTSTKSYGSRSANTNRSQTRPVTQIRGPATHGKVP